MTFSKCTYATNYPILHMRINNTQTLQELFTLQGNEYYKYIKYAYYAIMYLPKDIVT